MIRTLSSLEPLESRIAPAGLSVINPLPDIVAGAGKTGATVELTEMFDSTVAHPNHTLLTFTVNLDSDTQTPGIQPSTFVMELFDDEAPLTVQNFLSYVQNPNTAKDFLGTFFHRAVSGFVVQGGGFDVSTLKHLPVGPEVHNEFDASRSNLMGTVAMAKTGLGPNTATSEWFVNLGDNGSGAHDLDTQNGGFTVFGRITSGLEVFTKIATLQTVNLGGALTSVPVQDYNSDPDHNPNTPAPKPTAKQLITITGVQVAPPAAGDATGYSFSVGDITGTDGLVTPKLVGNQLKLAYAPGKSGEADVTVHVQRGTDTVDETFHVTVLPNLIANVVTDSLPQILAPGDTSTAVVKLTNNAGGQFTSTQVDIKFYLSKVTDSDATGTTVDADDILIGSVTKAINLAGGASTNVTVPITVLQQLVPTEGIAYHLIAQVTPAAGSTPELYTDDNTAVDGNVHALVNQAGTVTVPNFGTRVISKLSFTEHDGDLVVVKVNGPGVADVTPDGDDFNLSVTGTSILSSVQLSAKPPVIDSQNLQNSGRVELHNTDVANPIGTLNLAATDIDGYTTISGGARTLNFGSLTGDHVLLVGALLPSAATPLTINVGSVTDYSLESDQTISSLTAVRWLDTGGDHNHIIAPAIDRLNITGKAAVAGSPKISGDLEADVTLGSRAKMSLFRVAGFFENATFLGAKTSSVDSVVLGGMQNANFFVGTNARPDAVSDFAKSCSIGTFTVTGAAAASGGDAFINSQVAATNIGAIKVVAVDRTNNTSFGFVADKIANYVRVGKAKLTGLKAPGTFDEDGDYSVTIL